MCFYSTPLEGTNCILISDIVSGGSEFVVKGSGQKVVYILWQNSTEDKPAWKRDRACFAVIKQGIATTQKKRQLVLWTAVLFLMPFWESRLTNQQSWMKILTELPEQEEPEIFQQTPGLWVPPVILIPKPRFSTKGNRWDSRERPRLLPTTTLALRTTLVLEVGSCQLTLANVNDNWDKLANSCFQTRFHVIYKCHSLTWSQSAKCVFTWI